MRRPIDVAWYHYNHYIKAREVSPIPPVTIPSEAKNPPVELKDKRVSLLLISWTGLATMATAYVAQVFEDRSDSDDADRVSRRLRNQALYAFG